MNIALLVATVDRKESVERLLNSLAQQTFRNFTVYIGDQNSSPMLQDIIDRFRSQINLFIAPSHAKDFLLYAIFYLKKHYPIKNMIG